MLLTLAEIRLQLKLEADDTAEDQLLELYARAAQKLVETNINRPLFATRDAIAEGAKWALSLDEHDDIRLAILLLLTHFWLNRSATTVENVRQLPLGVRTILGPYVITAPELDEGAL